MAKINLIIGVVVVSVLLAGGGYIKALRADNARLGHEAAAARVEADGLRKELRHNWQALQNREKEIAAINAATDLLRNQLEVLYEQDEEAKSWGGADLPKSIIDRLR